MRMKKFLSVFMSLVMLVSITAGVDLLAYASTYSGTCGADGDNVTWELDTETGILTISGTGDMKNYTSSSKAPWALYSDSIKKAVINSGVTDIGAQAFYMFQSLESVIIGNNVTNICESAFLCCESLVSVIIPNGVIYIGNKSFRRCTSLTNLIIPNSVKSIGNEAFRGCTSLASLTIPDSVTKIGTDAFANCKNLTNIAVDDNNQYYLSFDGILFNKDKTELIQYPIGNKSISYTVPDSVTIIGSVAFAACTSLKSITIPTNVKTINFGAFENCTNLADIYYIGNEEEWNEIEIESNNSCLKNATIHYNSCAHNYNLTSKVEPTCSECGYEIYTCSKCGEQVKNELAALGHDYNITDTVSPTCTEAGYDVYKCSRCGESYTANYVEPLGHSYDGGVVTKEATCTQSGTKKYTCTRCSATKSETIEKLSHSYSVSTVSPTCTEKGYDLYTCSVCAQQYKDNYKNALGHNTVKDAAVAATCTQTGKTEGSHCSRCGEVITAQTTVDALGHSYDGGVVTKEATCTQSGTKKYTCTRCSATKSETIEKLSHSYSVSTVSPTCTEKGYDLYTCSVCAQQYKDNYKNALGHNTVRDAAVAATCTQTGKTEGSHCSKCGAVIKAQEIIPTTSHTYAEKIEKDPNCCWEGTMRYTCVSCGNSYTTVIPATGQHTFSEHVRVAATCTSDGVMDHICEFCQYAYSTVIPATGKHEYGSDGKCIYCNAYNTVAVVSVGGETYTLGSNNEYVSPTVKKPSVSKLTKGKKQFKVTWKKVSGVSGYQVQYATDKKFKKNKKTVTVKGGKATSKTVKGLKSKKTYYVRVRTYKTVKVNGKSTKVYSGWSKAKSVKTK